MTEKRWKRLSEKNIIKKLCNFIIWRDEIIEFEGEDKTVTSRLALAVDVTFSGQLKKKFEKIRNEIHSGNLAQVKYFSSDVSHQRGELKQLPRVVIGAEIGNVKKCRICG